MLSRRRGRSLRCNVLVVVTQARKKSKIFDAQKQLEKLQRKDEDLLMETFQAERREEKKKIDQEVDEEWEERLKELTANFDADMEKRTGHKAKDEDRKVGVGLGSRVFVVIGGSC